MAARDKNLYALQAGVISMAFVSVGLLVALIMMWVFVGKRAQEVADAQSAAREATTKVSELESRDQLLLGVLGTSAITQEEFEALQTRVGQDEAVQAVLSQMKRHVDAAGGVSGGLPSYQRLADKLIEQASARERQLEQARRDVETAQARGRADRQAAETAQKKAEAQLAAVTEQLKQRNASFDEQLNSVRNEYLAAIRSLEQANTRYTNLDRQHQELTRQATQQVEELTGRIEDQAQMIVKLRMDEFDAPQGKITQVAIGGTEAWIDLGSADGLRPGVRFAVLDGTAIRISEAQRKARLEVVEVVGPHLARARILLDGLGNAVVSGDAVYSPSWRPGRTVRFALLGKIDLNGDGRDDRDLVRRVILANGGEIDEELLPDGRLIQNRPMSVDTRFLVVGDRLDLAGDQLTEGQQRVAREYLKMIDRSRQLGITQISADRLLGFLQGFDDDRSLRLGRNIRDTESDPVRAGSIAPLSLGGSVSSQFVPRKPGRFTHGQGAANAEAP